MGFVGPRLSTEEASAAFFAPRLAAHAHEHVVAAHLDGWWRVVAVSEGGSPLRDSIDLPVRRIVADALSHNVCAVVLAHNHPSGDPGPSEADVATTRLLESALRPLGIRLYDHLIFGAGGARTSFRRLGLL